jgi:hypothetical protein
MYGHLSVGLSASAGALVIFDAEKYDMKAPSVQYVRGFEGLINAREVYKMLTFKVGEEVFVVLIENQVES